MVFGVGMRVVLALVWAALGAVGAFAGEDSAADTHSTVRLISEQSSIRPGQKFWLGVEITPRENWHSYWKNPGDSGIAPFLFWEAPDGTQLADPLFAVPEPLPAGPLTNYGYKGPTVLLIEGRAPATGGPSLPLKLDMEWLVCEVECIPQDASLSLDIPYGDGAKDPSYRETFSAARAQLPELGYWEADLNIIGPAAQLIVYMSQREAEDVSDAYFFPEQDGVTLYSSEQRFMVTPAGLVIDMERFDGDEVPENGLGVLSVAFTGGTTQSFEVDANITATASLPSVTSGASGLPALQNPPSFPLWQAALFALVGGILLNLMPCVFPVLSLKAFSIVSASGRSAGALRLEGWAYTFGILVSFAAVVATLFALRAGGAVVGWGFQLQEPIFVGVMVALMLLIGLSLSGLFNISFGAESAGQSLTSAGGTKGAFFTGVLATLVATPCTAPLMAPAIGFALTQSALVSVVVFLALGLGLAMPFLILSHLPSAAAALPRPGPWMERFKQFLAFPMYLTAAWLLSVYVSLTDSQAQMILLFSLTGLVFAIWLWTGTARASVKGLSAAVSALCLYVLLGAPGLLGGSSTANTASEEIPFERATLDQMVAEDAPVFAYFTADWCITCKANEKVALHRAEIQALFQSANIRVVKGDWTNRNDDIAQLLSDYGRAGVPLYLLFPGGGAKAVVLPQILTPGIVREYVESTL